MSEDNFNEEQYLQDNKDFVPAPPDLSSYLSNKTTPKALTKDDMIDRNQELMDACDEFLAKRVDPNDGSMSASDVIKLKAEAFKQNQLLKGQATENIAVNVNDLREKSPDELLDLLAQLS